jgi:hypothetical protein
MGTVTAPRTPRTFSAVEPSGCQRCLITSCRNQFPNRARKHALLVIKPKWCDHRCSTARFRPLRGCCFMMPPSALDARFHRHLEINDENQARKQKKHTLMCGVLYMPASSMYSLRFLRCRSFGGRIFSFFGIEHFFFSSSRLRCPFTAALWFGWSNSGTWAMACGGAVNRFAC